jgi:hypothetical protein
MSVLNTAETTDFAFLQNVQTSCGAYPALCLVGTRVYSVVVNWPKHEFDHSSIQCWINKWMELSLCSIYIPSWCGQGQLWCILLYFMTFLCPCCTELKWHAMYHTVASKCGTMILYLTLQRLEPGRVPAVMRSMPTACPWLQYLTIIFLAVWETWLPFHDIYNLSWIYSVW